MSITMGSRNVLLAIWSTQLLLRVMGRQLQELKLPELLSSRQLPILQRRLHHISRGGSVGERQPPWGIRTAAESVKATNVSTIVTKTETPAQILREKVMECLNTTATIPNNRTKVQLWKASLPEPLCYKNSRTLQKLCLFGCIDIYLLGTAHVSNDSSADVHQLLTHIQPDCIVLELCDARLSLLTGGSNNNNNKNETCSNSATIPIEVVKEINPVHPIFTWKQHFFKWTNQLHSGKTDVSKNHPENRSVGTTTATTTTTGNGNWFQTMSSVLLSSVQADYAAQLGVELGGEFRCAYQYWYHQQQQQSSPPPHLILGDRPVQLTLIRAWESLSWWARTKVCIGLLWSSVPWGKPSTEELRAWLTSVMQNKNGTDILSQSLDELRQSFPTLHETIIAERDAWLAAKLIQTSHALQRQLQQDHQYIDTVNRKQRRTIVAVVGAGHVPGIVQWLTTTTTTSTTTPEQVLAKLVTTKRWMNDTIVQQEMIPQWIYDIVEVNADVSMLQQ